MIMVKDSVATLQALRLVRNDLTLLPTIMLVLASTIRTLLTVLQSRNPPTLTLVHHQPDQFLETMLMSLLVSMIMAKDLVATFQDSKLERKEIMSQFNRHLAQVIIIQKQLIAKRSRGHLTTTCLHHLVGLRES